MTSRNLFVNVNVCANVAFQMRSTAQQGAPEFRHGTFYASVAPPLRWPSLRRADRCEDLLTELPGILHRQKNGGSIYRC
jgi:hypothetical protein